MGELMLCVCVCWEEGWLLVPGEGSCVMSVWAQGIDMTLVGTGSKVGAWGWSPL